MNEYDSPENSLRKNSGRLICASWKKQPSELINHIMSSHWKDTTSHSHRNCYIKGVQYIFIIMLLEVLMISISLSAKSGFGWRRDPKGI